jgi:hypothetical protein
MVVKRRPTCKPGEPIFDYPFMIGTEVVARYLVSMTLSALFVEPPFKGEWTTHISYLIR